ncbi:MAG: type VI secretion system baseplate subunit TssK [Candidatus Poribacteria bacterium]
MAKYNKIVWSEGMFLTPHHFQQWDTYQSGTLNARLRSLIPYDWGVSELTIDREGLANGNLTLLACRGIFRDGCSVNIPDLDEVPSPRKADEHFLPNMDALETYIAIPLERPNAANCLLSGKKATRETRYIEDSTNVLDYNTGENERQVSAARKNIKILFQDELTDEYEVLKIARLVRTPTGTIGIQNEYIPPCLNISSSPRLIGLIRGLFEILIAKSNELSAQCRQRTNEVYEFGATDVFVLWLIQTLNSFIPPLGHFYKSQTSHPAEIYQALSQFTGVLSTLAVNIRASDVPEYRHDDLMFTFNGLDTMIRMLLNLVSAPTSKFRIIPLQKVSETSYQGRIDDSSLFMPQYKFFMSIKSDVSQEKIIDEIPKKAKIGSIETIELLTHSALPGVSLFYSALPPSAIPRKSGYVYFSLDNRGPYWDSIRKSSSMAVFIPPDFPRPEIEMVAVED